MWASQEGGEGRRCGTRVSSDLREGRKARLHEHPPDGLPPRAISASQDSVALPGTPRFREDPLPTLDVSAMAPPKGRGVLGLVRGSKNRAPSCGTRFNFRQTGFSDGDKRYKSMVLWVLTAGERGREKQC
ncbi:hypothetical protein GUJ93_ZPchr0004g38277 [Zizania palustris]|uniref:Uncharacterized protein n=1 Tax=Zizania palustris TaxID=103762 RepID=A0A8J5SAG5_ZIZPA|nr:hypothetical protein GUJ93_ZPchr0004g38277 [Zizania palustris]